MSDSRQRLYQDCSRKFARLAVEANPKLVERYFSGESVLTELLGWAMKESRGSINPGLTGEWVAIELKELRKSWKP